MSPYVKRWITGLIAFPFLIALIIYSSESAFSLFVIAVIFISVWEYNRLVFDKQGHIIEKIVINIVSFIIPVSFYFGDMAILVNIITFSFFVIFLSYILQVNDRGINVFNIGRLIIGCMYLPLFMSYFILLRHLANGVLWVLFTIFIAFAGDIGGFYVGRIFGTKKLHPLISPGKTVEGALGMISGSIICSIIFLQIFFPNLILLHSVVLGVISGIMGQLGDLFESAIKRSVGAKDAGFIFPGHGGIMDRLDSISFIAPLVFYYHNFLIR